MISDFVSIGDKLELQKINKKENEVIFNKVYVSQLLDFLEDDKATIAMPIDKGRIIPLDIGDKYILCFYARKGLYQCKAVITNRSRNENVYILEIQFLSELEKFQRRQFYRLECIIDITYHIITKEETTLANMIRGNKFQNEVDKSKAVDTLINYQKIWYNGTITDLSGGGARFNSNYIHESGDNLQIDMNIGLNESIKKVILDCNVISSNKIANRIGYYEHRVQFKDISKDEREAIIKYIFEEERRLRKREKSLE